MAEQKKNNEALNMEEALTQSEDFLIKNKKSIIGVIVAIVVIVVGVVMYKHLYADPREAKAQAALFKGQEYFEANEYEQALNGDSIGYAGFLKVADEYSGTDAGNLANAYAGICYARLGKYDEAIKALDSFSGNDQMVTPALKGAKLLVGLAAGDKINITEMNKEISLIGGFSRKLWCKVGTDENGQHYSRPFTWKEYFKTWLNIELMFALFRFQARKYIRCLRNKT